MTIEAPYLAEAVRRAASPQTEAQARATILKRHAAELDALIRKADAAFADKVYSARCHYAMLLRRLPWDWQADARNHEMVVFCEELIGSGVGERMAWEVICRGGIT